MASRIVPGGRDSRGTCVRVRKVAAQRYPSDLTNLAWPRLRHLLIQPNPRAGRPCPAGVGTKVAAILYVNRTGCTWGMVPHDFAVSWATHKHFLRWTSDGT